MEYVSLSVFLYNQYNVLLDISYLKAVSGSVGILKAAAFEGFLILIIFQQVHLTTLCLRQATEDGTFISLSTTMSSFAFL